MKIIIPFKTPTINHLYYHRGNMKILTREARDIRKKIKQIITETVNDYVDWTEQKLSVTVEIFENWFNKDGTVKKKDVANREKFLIDSVFNALGIDDKYIFEQTIFKTQIKDDGQEKTIINIEVLE